MNELTVDEVRTYVEAALGVRPCGNTVLNWCKFGLLDVDGEHIILRSRLQKYGRARPLRLISKADLRVFLRFLPLCQRGTRVGVGGRKASED